jgi:ubiquinone/menaquinone biosynthesis C-methylase UbiE
MQIDIQEIAYPDETFDIVIANYMLYHVPNISKALSEVRRVLKNDGIFYSATNGNGGMFPFLNKAFKHFDPDSKAFTHEVSFSLQNGYEILNRHFTDVIQVDYNDSLAITETQDLIDWIKSTSYVDHDIDYMFDYFENIRVHDGAINIPKETGLFISRK